MSVHVSLSVGSYLIFPLKIPYLGRFSLSLQKEWGIRCPDLPLGHQEDWKIAIISSGKKPGLTLSDKAALQVLDLCQSLGLPKLPRENGGKMGKWRGILEFGWIWEVQMLRPPRFKATNMGFSQQEGRFGAVRRLVGSLVVSQHVFTKKNGTNLGPSLAAPSTSYGDGSKDQNHGT